MDLIETMAKSVIEEATTKVLYNFEFVAGPVPPETIQEMQSMAEVQLTAPIGILLMVRTKDKAQLIHSVLDSVLKALQSTKLVDVNQIRQMLVERESSFEEIAELYIFALEE